MGGLRGVSASALRPAHLRAVDGTLSSASQDLWGEHPSLSSRLNPSPGIALGRRDLPPPRSHSHFQVACTAPLAYVGTQSQAPSPRGATQSRAPRGGGSAKGSAGTAPPSSSCLCPILLPSCHCLMYLPHPTFSSELVFPGNLSWDNGIMVVWPLEKK